VEFSWSRIKIELAPYVSLLLEKKELSFVIKPHARYSHEEQIQTLADFTVKEIRFLSPLDPCFWYQKLKF